MKISTNFKNILFYITQNYLRQLLNVVFSILSIRLLSVNELGKYNLAKSIGAIFEYTHLGTRFTVDRKIPECNESNKSVILSVSFYLNAITSFIVFSILSFFNLGYFYSVFFISSIFFANINLIRVFYRANSETVFFLRITFILNMTTIIFQIIGLLIGGLWGILILSLINNSLFIGYLLHKKIKISSFKEIRIWFYSYSIKKGFIFYLNGLVLYLAVYADRIIISSYGGESRVGEYSIIFFFLSYLKMIPTSIGEMIYPEFIKKKKDKKLLTSYVKKTFVLFTSSIITIEILTLLLIPIVTKTFFSEYIYLIVPMKIGTLAILPYCAITIIYYLLFANDKSLFILYSNIIALIVFFLSLIYFLQRDFGYEYIALCKSLYSIFYLAFLSLFYVLFRNKKSLISIKK